MQQRCLHLFLFFKGTTQAYLLKISITHNKNLIPLLYLFINCISDKSALQILSLNAACTFLFLNFLIFTGRFASAVAPPPFDFLSKNL